MSSKDALANQVVRYLNSIGITGLMIHQKRKNKTLQFYNYHIFNKENIGRLMTAFKLYKSDLRVRCQLIVKNDPVLIKVCQCLESFDIVCLGLILEKPRTAKDLWAIMRKKEVNESIKRMTALGVLVEKNGILLYEPSGIKEYLRQRYQKKIEDATQKSIKIINTYPSKCTACSKVSWQKTCEDCGAKTKPISRVDAVMPLTHRIGALRREAKKLN